MTTRDLFSSVFGGAVAELSVLPICTIQTVYQTQNNLHSVTKRESILQVTRNLYRTHGIRAFYNASASSVMSQMVSTGSKFTLYKLIQRQRETAQNDILNNMINGGVAGVLSTIFIQPFDVFKTYHQRQERLTPEIKKSEGRVLYRGIKQAAAKNTLLIACLYPVNDLCRTHISNPALAAAATTVIITPIINPIDLLKRRAIAGLPLWLGWNPIHYYRGIFVNMSRSMPHFMVTMMTIEWMRTRLDKWS